MSPSEYQELTSFFVEHVDRHQAETRALIAASQQETKSFVGVIVESLRHEIRLVADGVLTNTRAIEGAHRRIDANTRAIEDLGTRTEANGTRIDANTRALEEHSRRLDEHGRRLEENSARIEANGARIEANGARIEANGARIEANGARIDALTNRVERLETTVGDRFDGHEQRLRVLEQPRR